MPSESPVNTTVRGPIEITDDLSTVKTVLSELIDAMNRGRRSRERSLVVTKLQEAKMWAEEAQIVE